MGPNTSENLEKLAKTSKKLVKTLKNFAKLFTKTFFTAQYSVSFDCNYTFDHGILCHGSILLWSHLEIIAVLGSCDRE